MREIPGARPLSSPAREQLDDGLRALVDEVIAEAAIRELVGQPIDFGDRWWTDAHDRFVEKCQCDHLHPSQLGLAMTTLSDALVDGFGWHLWVELPDDDVSGVPF